MTAQQERLHSIPGVVDRLSISRSSVYMLIRSGALTSVKSGGRRLVSESAINEYIDRLREQSESA